MTYVLIILHVILWQRVQDTITIYATISLVVLTHLHFCISWNITAASNKIPNNTIYTTIYTTECISFFKYYCISKAY